MVVKHVAHNWIHPTELHHPAPVSNQTHIAHRSVVQGKSMGWTGFTDPLHFPLLQDV